MKRKDIREERRRQRVEENRRFILQAAEKVFAIKGYSLTSMDEIAEEAQFSKATLYRYYKGKSEIFFEIISKSFDEIQQKVVKILKEENSAEKKLRELVYQLTSYYHRKKNITRIFLMERAVMSKILAVDSAEHAGASFPHPPIPAPFRRKMEEIFEIMCRIINEGIQTGEFRRVEAAEACSVLGAMIRGFHFRGPVPRHKEYSVTESTELVLDYFLKGIKKP